MRPLIVFFSGKTGNTKKFIERIGDRHQSVSIKHRVEEPFILFTSTYADAQGRRPVPTPVITFLNNEENRKNLLGVVCGGNKNFGEYYGIAADVISQKCKVPIIMKFELTGTDEEVNLYKQKVQELLNESS